MQAINFYLKERKQKRNDENDPDEKGERAAETRTRKVNKLQSAVRCKMLGKLRNVSTKTASHRTYRRYVNSPIFYVTIKHNICCTVAVGVGE